MTTKEHALIATHPRTIIAILLFISLVTITHAQNPVFTPVVNCGPQSNCSEGYCCSLAGFCDRTTAYCGPDCNPLYGACGIVPVADASAVNCGSSFGGVSCGNGDCCSSTGFCGTGQDYCGTGCNPLYGACDNIIPAQPSNTGNNNNGNSNGGNAATDGSSPTGSTPTNSGGIPPPGISFGPSPNPSNINSNANSNSNINSNSNTNINSNSNVNPSGMSSGMTLSTALPSLSSSTGSLSITPTSSLSSSSTSPAGNTTPSVQDFGSQLNMLPIILGSVLGGVAFLVMLAGVFYYCRRRYRRRNPLRDSVGDIEWVIPPAAHTRGASGASRRREMTQRDSGSLLFGKSAGEEEEGEEGDGGGSVASDEVEERDMGETSTTGARNGKAPPVLPHRAGSYHTQEVDLGVQH